MSEAAAASIDLSAEVAVPEGEVSREQLVKILEDSRKSEPKEDGAAVSAPSASDVEPAKAPTEKVSARIIANRKAEARAKAEREAIAADRKAIEADRTAIAEAKALKAQIEAAALSPSKLLEMAKRSPKEFLEALATEHEPEAVARREVQEQLSKQLPEIEQLKARIKAFEEERANELQARRHHEAQQATQQGGEAFVEHVAANAEKYPALVETMTPQQFVSAGFACLHEVVGHRAGKPVSRLEAYQAEHDGQPPTDDEIAEFLESRAQPVFQARNAWRERLGKSAPNPSQGTPAIQGQPVTAAKPRTLTNGASATNASAPKRELTDAEAREESIRLIEQLHASRNAI